MAEIFQERDRGMSLMFSKIADIHERLYYLKEKIEQGVEVTE